MTLIKAKEKKKMKTRSNMPLFVLEVSDVKALSNSQIDLLRCGDYLVKKDASGEHAYKVTFKSDTGMCLTYHDASVIETQSYDKVDGNWVYNSEDKTENLLDVATKEDIEGGTLENAKPLYFHPITIVLAGQYAITMIIINNQSEAFTKTTLIQYLSAETTRGRYMLNGSYYTSGEDGFYLSPSYVIYRNNDLYLYGIDSNGVTHSNAVNQIYFSNVLNNATTFEDEVNKIN